VPREVWYRPLIVSPTLYRMLEKRGADMRFYKMNEPIPEMRRPPSHE